ncbi:uncharacterized protein LOC107043501 [Diachasma alloeum]|uniref:uncharacterized protein LOC107043501 n=1 Tax=Diachasma alloeum TaxID=454923 RepID=UPI0007384A3D|nr:uncharacterized protein LOC107043501 [Diachasma alloeum]
MDGTFDVVPNMFLQLYSIHAPVDPPERSRTLPLVYTLMSSKSKECYDAFFGGLIEYAEANDIDLSQNHIITVLELAPIIVPDSHFPEARNGACLFHLRQCVYRKLQSNKLVKDYGTNENFSIAIRQITSLAFLTATEIPPAWDELKEEIPEKAKPIVDWFDDNYVHGKVIRLLRGKPKRSAPKFPPSLWSVHDRMEENLPRTQNKIEAWHRRLRSLVGHLHAGMYTLINELKKEQKTEEGEIEYINRGEGRPKMKRADAVREERIRQIFQEREQYDDVLDWIRGLAHNIKIG